MPMGISIGDYGAVFIGRGKHQGKIGYYDDDEAIGKGPIKAVVYLGDPHNSEIVKLSYTSIGKVSSIRLQHFINANPKLCKQLGIYQ